MASFRSVAVAESPIAQYSFQDLFSCRLDQLNVAWCGMDTEILNVLFANITPRIRKLNISGTERSYGLIDDRELPRTLTLISFSLDVQMLTRVCPNLSELDLSDNVDIGISSIFFIVEYLLKLQVISLNRCYGINPNYLQ